MDKDDAYSLISIRLQMLINLFGRKVNDEQLESMKRVYCEALGNMPLSSISQGFGKAERTCERFPTPKLMRELCGEFIHGRGGGYNYRDGMATDPETGREVKIKIDGDSGDILYKAADCPEGRAFLALLHKLGDKKKFPQAERKSKSAIDK